VGIIGQRPRLAATKNGLSRREEKIVHQPMPGALATLIDYSVAAYNTSGVPKNSRDT
jgi:hypothetical protein